LTEGGEMKMELGWEMKGGGEEGWGDGEVVSRYLAWKRERERLDC
jgi:hypothetical protein